MKYNEVIYSIREKLREVVDDSNIDDREIIFEVNNQRALFYRNEYNKNSRAVDEEIKQTLCVSLEEASDDECCIDSDCTILRSTIPLPNLLELHHKNTLLRVTSTQLGTKPFSLVSWNQFPFSGNSKYNSKEVYVSKHNNGYLYFKSSNRLHKFLEKVSVQVILEDPLDIKDFMDCASGTDCFNLDTFNYPIKAHVLAYITPQVLKSFAFKLQIPEDLENDAESK
jgi:hypothetical protein